MKKLLFLAIAIMLVSCNQNKVAYIDVEVLMKDYEATKELESSLKEKLMQYQSSKLIQFALVPLELEKL